MAVWWALWGTGLANLVAISVSMTMRRIMPRLPRVVIMSATVTTVVGTFSGLALILLSGAGVVLIVGTVVLLVFAALFTALVLGQLWLSYQGYRSARRRLSRDEVLDLIRAGRVRSFTRRDDDLELALAPITPDHSRLQTRRADPRDYLVFVAAAGPILVEGSKIRFHDETGQGPSSAKRRWITFDEAAALLSAGKVKTLSYGNPGDCRPAFCGNPTGIGLSSRGRKHHLRVAAELEAALVPLARAAKVSHGRPRLRVYGRWER